jgi:hypothetical protein
MQEYHHVCDVIPEFVFLTNLYAFALRKVCFLWCSVKPVTSDKVSGEERALFVTSEQIGIWGLLS